MLLLSCTKTAFAQSNVIDSLQHIVALQRHDTTELHAMLGLTYEYLRRDLPKAKRTALQVISLADTRHEVRWLSGAYNYLITIYQQTGNLDSARHFIGLSQKLANENPENFKMKFNYNQSVSLFYKNTGEYKKALPYMLANLEAWQKEDESRAGQLLNLGNLYINLSEFKNAATAHLQAFRLFENLKNKRGQSFCLQSLGSDFSNLKQFEQAKKYYLQSLKLKKELNDKRGTVSTYIALGEVHKELKEFKLADKYLKEALRASREMKLSSDEARSQYLLGLLNKQIGDMPGARSNFSLALSVAKEAGDSTLSAKINSELFRLDFEEKKERQVETTLLSNLTTLLQSGDRRSEVIEYSRLSEYYASRKQYDKAFEYLQRHEMLKDSLEGTTVLLQLKELEEQYKSEKKEKEIAILKKDQELQTLALSRERTSVILIAIALFSVIIIGVLLINRYRIMNRARRMLELEKMRNHIARDLHDDIGSTLSSINIMSQLALQENGNAGNHLKKIANHSANMMEKMSDIVWSINPKNDSLEQVVMKMKEFSAEILEPKNIDYSFHIEDSIYSLKLDAEKRKNIFLIFKEAVNNAAKYSEGNNVTISLSVKNHQLYLTVRDNGKGFNPALGTTGNGLRNMEDRAVTMNGKLIRASEPGTGTEIQLEIPLT